MAAAILKHATHAPAQERRFLLHEVQQQVKTPARTGACVTCIVVHCPTSSRLWLLNEVSKLLLQLHTGLERSGNSSLLMLPTMVDILPDG